MRTITHSNGLMALVAIVGISGGFLLGSQARPRTEMSVLAAAQLMSHDKRVEWVGYQCGDDRATVLSREMPNIIGECKEARRLDEDVLLDEPLG